MIPALTLTNIVFTYPGTSEPLLDGIDVTFARGWTAVLGDNGIGKHARTIYVVVSKLGQQRRDLSALLDVEVIGDMHELFGLCLERREHSRVAMT